MARVPVFVSEDGKRGLPLPGHQPLGSPPPTPGGTCADMCVAANPFLSHSPSSPNPVANNHFHRLFPPCGKGSNFVATQGQCSSRRVILFFFLRLCFCIVNANTELEISVPFRPLSLCDP